MPDLRWTILAGLVLLAGCNDRESNSDNLAPPVAKEATPEVPPTPAEPAVETVDPVKEFTRSIAAKLERLKTETYLWQNQDETHPDNFGKWLKTRYDVQSYELDVKKTDSLVSPMTGELWLKGESESTGLFPTKQEAERKPIVKRKRMAGWPAPEWKITYAYQGDKWVIRTIANRRAWPTGVPDQYEWGEWQNLGPSIADYDTLLPVLNLSH